MSGWLKFDRDMFEHPIFKPEPLTEREAWMWLIMKAAWRETTHRVGNEIVTVPRGSLLVTLRELQVSWRWTSDKRVRAFLSILEKDGMIGRSADAGKTQINICNYSKFQGEGRNADDNSDEQRTQRGRSADALNKEGEEDKKVKKKESLIGSVGANPREVEPDRKELSPPPSAALPTVAEITTAVVSALGDAGDPVALGIGVVAPVLGLLKAGFTLDGDIVPACQDRSRRPGRSKIRSYEIIAQISREYRERSAVPASSPAAARSPPKARNWPAETWRGYVKRWREGAMVWPETFGPKPGQPGCEVPKEILESELNIQVPA